MIDTCGLWYTTLIRRSRGANVRPIGGCVLRKILDRILGFAAPSISKLQVRPGTLKYPWFYQCHQVGKIRYCSRIQMLRRTCTQSPRKSAQWWWISNFRVECVVTVAHHSQLQVSGQLLSRGSYLLRFLILRTYGITSKSSLLNISSKFFQLLVHCFT